MSNSSFYVVDCNKETLMGFRNVNVLVMAFEEKYQLSYVRFSEEKA